MSVTFQPARLYSTVGSFIALKRFQVHSDLKSLVSNKGGLRHRVRIEKTGRPPEDPTQTVVQRIVKAAQDEVSCHFLLRIVIVG